MDAISHDRLPPLCCHPCQAPLIREHLHWIDKVNEIRVVTALAKWCGALTKSWFELGLRQSRRRWMVGQHQMLCTEYYFCCSRVVKRWKLKMTLLHSSQFERNHFLGYARVMSMRLMWFIKSYEWPGTSGKRAWSTRDWVFRTFIRLDNDSV